jgi:uncharacterized protein (DUF2164 family)
MPLKTSDEKQDSILKVFDYFEAESKLSLGENEMNIFIDFVLHTFTYISTYSDK